MPIKRVNLKDFTVFKELDIELCNGINVFIGKNGMGKTHLMKLIYSACQAVEPSVSFSYKIVKTFKPDDYRIGRLSNRKAGVASSNVKIGASYLDKDMKEKEINLSADFSTKTKKWDAEVKNEERWESKFGDLKSVFIPAKEILSNSYNLISAVEKNNVEFDDTYLDIIHSAKVDISAGRDLGIKKSQLSRLESIIEGKVYFDSVKDKFYLKHGASKVEFNLVAEGIRKIALLWQLMKNGTLVEGSVLFWDEPEANINPQHLPLIVDMLLELQENGVQIFISTHDYILAKYFDVKAKDNQSIMFHSLYKEDEEQGVKCESNKKFKDLKENTIRDMFIQLYKDEIERDMQ